MILISILITIVYLLLIGSFVYGFDKISVFRLEESPAKIKFSIIIPFRNESENLPDLLDSIASLEFPKHLFEVILVDDDSDDASVNLIEKYFNSKSKEHRKGFDCAQPDIQLIKNERQSNSPKKDAISTAIKQAKHEWIVTTDADCILPKYWLDGFDQFIQKSNAKCIVAPVTYSHTIDFLSRFQLLDLLSLQGATIGGFGINKPFLCNGANFAYQKSLFLELNGFEGNDNVSSGDDIFLLEKVVKKHPKALHYLKCEQAIVTTKPQPTWKDLMSQRIRWAAKTSAYNNWFGKLTGIIVLGINGLLISLVLLTALGHVNLKFLLYILIIKLNIDFLLIYKTASFFNKKGVLGSYLFAFFVYPFFSLFIALTSIFWSYKWKGRKFKK